MMWELAEEHEVCYKDKDVLRAVNELTDLFDDVIAYIYNSYDHCNFFADVFFTENDDVCTGINEQLIKYTEMFIDNDYIQKCVERSKENIGECEYKNSGNILDLLKEVFDLRFNQKHIIDDKKILELLETLSKNINRYMNSDNADLYKLTKFPVLFDEFYALIFISHIIRCENYTFLIMYGTSD